MNGSSGLTPQWKEGGILHLVFDRPGEKLNLLTPELMSELDRRLDEVRGHAELRGILVTSAKPGSFIAGMDLERIAEVSDSQQAAAAARFGQAVFQKLADIKRPSVCAIGGTCLGGGTELALACTFRVAADVAEVQIGLPEVKLGIIPGFGGTQRLPRLVGLQGALDLILTGRALDARRARRVGLVDRVVPASYLEREALGLLRRAIGEGPEVVAAALRRRRGLVARAIEGIGPARRFVLIQARKRTEKRVSPRDYPAPYRALVAIDGAFAHPLRTGLDLEARLVGELVPNSTTKNLIWLFKTQTALKGQRNSTGAAPRKVKRIAVVGAGIMGGGIAQLAADREIPVRLKDLRQDAILSALQTAASIFAEQVRRGRLTERQASQRLACIAPTLDDSGMRHLDLVIEAVVERLDVKQQVLAAFEQRMGERAVFASNTSSLPISDIAARARHPERVVGLHFFNPVHRMPLVEIIAGRRSSPEAVATVQSLAIRLGKIPVIVEDGPGFLVNRILTFYVNEALRLLKEGVRIEAADRAMRAFGMPIGPFELLDEAGLDTCEHVGHVLKAGLGSRVGDETTVLEALVAGGRLGKKNGRGFYGYAGKKRTATDRTVYELVGSPAPRELPPETLQERMVLVMLNEAARCLDEAVVRHARDVDVALVLGTGFPPFRGGLLRHADEVGVPIIVDRLSRLADAHGERFRPGPGFDDMVRERRRFYAGAASR